MGHASVALDGVGPKQEDLRDDRGVAQSSDRGRAPVCLSRWHRAQAQLGRRGAQRLAPGCNRRERERLSGDSRHLRGGEGGQEWLERVPQFRNVSFGYLSIQISSPPGVRPWSWTGSRGGFDPLPGVVILELRGAQVAERGVQPASVVDLVNEAGKIRGDVLECFVVHKVDGFDLQRLDEAFGLGVVVGVSTPAHRADEPMLCEQLAVSLTGILRTSIRVVDTAPGRLPGLNSGLQCCNCQTCVDRAANRISDHPARPGVENGSQIDEAGADGDVRDVGHPELVRTVHNPVAGEVREDGPVVVAVGRGHEPLTALGLQVVLTHETADLLGIDENAAMAQLGANPAIAVGLELIADRDQVRDDLGVISLQRRRVVKGGARQAHQAASFGNGEAMGPAVTDVVAFLGRGVLLEAPLKNSISSACRPTMRSRAAIFASYSCKRSAARMSSSKAPASYFATQMRIRLRDRSWRFASACRVSPAMYSWAT